MGFCLPEKIGKTGPHLISWADILHFWHFLPSFIVKNAPILQPTNCGCKYVFLFSSSSLLLPFSALFFFFLCFYQSQSLKIGHQLRCAVKNYPQNREMQNLPAELKSRSLGNGVRKNGVRDRCPYRQCWVDTEIPYRLFSLILSSGHLRLSLLVGFGGIEAVDTEFPYRVPIVDRGAIAVPLFADPWLIA